MPALPSVSVTITESAGRHMAGRIWGRGIEWDAVRVLLAGEARTAAGRERALAAEPLTSSAFIHEALEETHQARLALGTDGPPPLDSIPDVRGTLDHAGLPGSVLEGMEMIPLVHLLDAVPRVQAYGRSVRAVAARLADVMLALPRLGDLRDRLRRALDDEGQVTDDASPTLRRVRRELRERRRKLVADLERLFHVTDADRIFSDRYVTVRHGRYVLPVRADARTRLRGIVHDRSQSGQTIFLEPTEALDANNDLVQLAREEEQEVARILAELTDGVREHLGALEDLVQALADLDWVFARAHLAERMQATLPVVDDTVRTVALREARHPLLLAQAWADPARTVVPVDLELSAERPLLLVTGPNAGGKTIALKTLALHALMAQVGCHLPAEDGSRLPVFEHVHAIIGDDQSVAENLSTFSAFVKQVREILDEADARSLVLLDELGAGTDPDEGAALAQAILEALAERGALVMATTHLEPLKAFASTHPLARNASAEFDAATLAPTFRLRYDRPGQSYALTIAARLGLDPELIRRAQGHRSQQAARMADLIARLDESTRSETARLLALERREAVAAGHLAAAREAEAAAEARAREIVARARGEATGLLGDVRRAVAAEWDRLKHGERTRRDLDESRRRLAGVATRLAPAPEPLPAAEALRLGPGSAVTADHLGLRGEIVAVAGAMATVRAGNMTIRVPLQALRPAVTAATPPPRSDLPPPPAARARADIRVPEKSGIAPEIHLLGRTTDEARDLVEQYLDDAFMAGLSTVRIVHGKGTGALRKAVRDLLAGHPLVESHRDGEPSEGGTGATVATLRVG